MQQPTYTVGCLAYLRKIMDSADIVMILSNPLAPDPRVYKEARCLVARGLRVIVACWDRKSRYSQFETVDGIRIMRVRTHGTYGKGLIQGLFILGFYARSLFELMSIRFKTVHCHDLETLPLGYLLKKLFRKDLVYDAHEPCYFSDARYLRGLTVKVGALLERLLARTADGIIVTNERQNRKYRRFGCANVTVVPNYPDISPIPRPVAVRQHHKKVAIGCIGALAEDYGLENLIAACKMISGKVDIELFLVGNALSEYARKLRTLARRHEFLRLFPGYLPDELPAYYDRVDIIVIPFPGTDWCRHSTPVRFFEALYFGKPVIATNTSEIATIIQMEQCGIVIDDNDPQTIAWAILQLISTKENWAAMGKCGFDAVQCTYNWGHSIRQLFSAYDNLVRHDQRLSC